MGLGVWLMELKRVESAYCNITHNITPMARKAGIYEVLWKSETPLKAKDLEGALVHAIEDISVNWSEYEKLNPQNGFGSVESFYNFLRVLRNDCRQHPDAEVEFSR